MIITRDREAGNIIENFATKKEAEKAISRYEKKDKKEGTYSPDFYEVAEIEDESFWAKKLGAKEGLILENWHCNQGAVSGRKILISGEKELPNDAYWLRLKLDLLAKI